MKEISKESKRIKTKDTSSQQKIGYVVLELAYFDEFLSAVDIIGVYTNRQKAFKVSKEVTIINTGSQYSFKGVVQETIIN